MNFFGGGGSWVNPVITINYGEDKTATTTIGADNTFSAEIKDLTPKTEYTFRATFKAGELEGASDEIIKTTPNTFSITTTNVNTDVTATSAKVGGTLSGEYDGITTYGVEYKKEGDANFEAFPIEDENFTATNTIFAGNLTGLAPGTNYIVRAFATNQYGTDYGETKGFTTLSGEVTEINTALEGNEHATSATVKVTFNYSGIEIDSEKATKRVYYSESAPTADDDINDFPHAEGGEISGDEENGYSFTANLTDFTPNKTYYVIGYFEFRDAEGQSKLSEVHTPLGFTVTTADATEVTANSATCGGTIDNTDGQEIEERGVYYSMNSFTEENLGDATILLDNTSSDNNISVATVEPISCNTTVYYCAFAKSEHGIAYGEVKTFTTPNALSDFILEKESDEVPNKVKLKGSFSFCGEEIGTNDSHVTIKYGPEGNKEERTITVTNYSDEGLGGSAKNFTCELSDLTPNTEYFAQAYFSHGGFEQTSEELTFTTPKAFTVQTNEGTTNLTATSANVSGQVVKKDTDYSLKDPQCRFYYVAAAEPLTEITAVTDAGTYVDGNLVNNSFTGDIEGLTPNTTYYYVACAKEGENDWEYGEVKSFTTNSQAQITSITPITRTNKSAELRVSFTMQGDLPAGLAYGVYCSPDQIDDITGLDIKYGSAPTDSVDNIHKYYDVTINGLANGKTYYVLPYISEAENFTVIHLNEDQTFTTKTGEVTELKLGIERDSSTFVFKGTYVYDGKTIESGDNLIKVYYGEGENFANVEENSVVATTNTQSKTYMAEISGLEYGKEYYARAYFKYEDAEMTSNVEQIPIPDGIGEITDVTTIASADSAKVRVQFTYQGKTLDGSAIAKVYLTENMGNLTNELTPAQETSNIVSDGDNLFHFEVVLTGLEANKEYFVMQEVKIGEVDIDPTDKWQFSEFRTANGEWANHSYIDLGGDVVWATTNLGADSPELEGDLYRWGETTSTAGNIDDNKDEDYSITVTSWEQGDPAYDAAASQWGNGWRMPTIAELALLTDTGVCKSTYDNNNHARVITKSPETSAKLYLPTGTTEREERKGFYYSSDYQTEGYEGSKYLYVEGENDFHTGHCGPGSRLRFIRPVLPKAPIVSAVTAVKKANGKYDVSVTVTKTIYEIVSVGFQYKNDADGTWQTAGTNTTDNVLYTAEIDLIADTEYQIRASVTYKKDGVEQSNPIYSEVMTLKTDPTGSGSGSGN